MPSDSLLVLAAIGGVGVLCQWAAWRLKTPAIMLLLPAGVLVGPVSGLLDPDLLLGDLLFPVVSLAVGVILFEGALTLRFREIRGLAGVVRNLVTVGALVTWAVVAVATKWLVGVSWEIALLFGSLVVVTGPTVIVPMLRTIRPDERISQTLRWEGIVIDPLGALLAVLVFDWIIARYATGSSHDPVWQVFLQTVLAGTAAGLLAGVALAKALQRHWIPDYLRSVLTLVLVCCVFAVSDWLAPESGLLAVTIMGVTLANADADTPLDDILNFKESLSVLLIGALFIILAARLDLAALTGLGWSAVAVLATVMLLARPLGVLLSTIGSNLTWQERVVVAWIGPRGIVAAAVSALFALKLEQAGVAGAGLVVPLTFTVIMGTVLIQGATAGPLARLLGVAEPESRGVLVVGANRLARAVGKALKDKGYRVLVTDTSWDAVGEARMAGLGTFYGSAVSDHADLHLDLVGIGKLLALSGNAHLNALSCERYAAEFGIGQVFLLPVKQARANRTLATRRGRRLFGEDATFARLSSLLAQGGEIRTTRLTEEFGLENFQERWKQQAIPLFGIDPEGDLHPVLADARDDAQRQGPGWTLISLVPADANDRRAPDPVDQGDTAGSDSLPSDPSTAPAGGGA